MRYKRWNGRNQNKIIMKSIHKSPTCLAIPHTVNGVKWEIHNHDADINNPSCPHLHAIGKPWKLDIYTGLIYDVKTGKQIGMVKYNDLISIWTAKGVYQIILAERLIYEELREKNPRRLPALPPLIIQPKIGTRNRNNQYTHSASTLVNRGKTVVSKTRLSNNRLNITARRTGIKYANYRRIRF